MTAADLAATVREALGIREWAASCTPSKYGEKVEREMPDAFAALDALQAQAENPGLAHVTMERFAREYDRAKAAEKRAADSHDVMIRVYARADAAEAERDRLREERDALRESGRRWAVNVRSKEEHVRRLAARVTELEAALRAISARMDASGKPTGSAKIARAALTEPAQEKQP